MRHRQQPRTGARQIGSPAHEPAGKLGKAQRAINLARKFDESFCTAPVLL